MPNLKLAPRVATTRTSRHRRRRTSRRKSARGWWQAAKVAVLIERFRRRRSSPSVRQIALVVVSGGLVIMLIRVATRKAKSHADGPQVAAAQDGAQDDTPDEAPRVSRGRPLRRATTPAAGSERRLTDRVQQEMSRRADAPTQAGGSGSG